MDRRPVEDRGPPRARCHRAWGSSRRRAWAQDRPHHVARTREAPGKGTIRRSIFDEAYARISFEPRPRWRDAQHGGAKRFSISDRFTTLFDREKTQARIVFLACVQPVHVLSRRVSPQLGVELRDQHRAPWIVRRELTERHHHYFGQPVCGSNGVIFRAFW